MIDRPPVILHAMIVRLMYMPVEVKTSHVVGPKEIKSSRPHGDLVLSPLSAAGTSSVRWRLRQGPLEYTENKLNKLHKRELLMQYLKIWKWTLGYSNRNCPAEAVSFSLRVSLLFCLCLSLPTLPISGLNFLSILGSIQDLTMRLWAVS